MRAMKTTRLSRRQRVLIVGCGDIGLRAARLMLTRAARPRIIALTSRPERAAELRAAGLTPIVGDLDAARGIRRLAGIAQTVLHLAPPAPHGQTDARTRALLATLSAPAPLRPARQVLATTALPRDMRPWPLRVGRAIVTDRRESAGLRRVRLIYASTTGVYGDCGGALVDETRKVNPVNARAKRRVAAERQLRAATARGVLAASIVRIPGIYAAGRLPLARIEQRLPALVDEQDVYTNHIHADDLAAIMLRAIRRAGTSRIVHASDDTVLKMGTYFDRVADAYGLPRVPRVTRDEARSQLTPLTLSFMSESRRLANRRLKRELRVTLRYPSVDDFLAGVRVK
ncbi:NAD-dependent dehydratase [Trinickia caryophylli]|uniref:Nucleoside-diphosphate-sugar epimerase n=2 Tax=Trinickia caryophylli TaxID=28094 RepID=A0A1X7H1X1_TRICW|nr:NAD-dependent dehydratase [Trinickia caryophylli]SMF77851.1 Nucleoside-diphosphate-sugar epimerase [Trinickia caryophylli]